ncbi:IS3 family transposase [Nocardia sp. BMG111209]|uniref:IS3 family transposase n=1 Tax=Nocardia sp. BMG111209 TaxID=1160137 RepID=UPI00350FFBFE
MSRPGPGGPNHGGIENRGTRDQSTQFALMERADWYNNARLHSRLDYLTPAEYEAAYYAQNPPRRPALV